MSPCRSNESVPLVSLLDALTRALAAQDPDATGHASRVASLAEIVARRLGVRELDALRLGGVLHDLGKLAVPQRVLLKPTALTPSELARIREHPSAGTRLLAPIEAVRAALPYVLFHHERWDGDGYPTGRAGAAIPLGARVLAVVDAFDAMTSDRPYRRALPPEAAIAEVDRCAGGQFDPVVARVFVGAWLEGEISVPASRAVA
jgi:HD-GYP domain-containing protein (c-di-GMP phosphodiesterase class II)